MKFSYFLVWWYNVTFDLAEKKPQTVFHSKQCSMRRNSRCLTSSGPTEELHISSLFIHYFLDQRKLNRVIGLSWSNPVQRRQRRDIHPGQLAVSSQGSEMSHPSWYCLNGLFWIEIVWKCGISARCDFYFIWYLLSTFYSLLFYSFLFLSMFPRISPQG